MTTMLPVYFQIWAWAYKVLVIFFGTLTLHKALLSDVCLIVRIHEPRQLREDQALLLTVFDYSHTPLMVMLAWSVLSTGSIVIIKITLQTNVPCEAPTQKTQVQRQKISIYIYKNVKYKSQVETTEKSSKMPA